MLKKSERLGRELFSKYFKIGKRTHKTYHTTIFSEHQDFLCSVVVGKKVSKKAVTRNSVRRRAYAMIASLKAERTLTGVYIFIMKPEVYQLNKKDFQIKVTSEFGEVLN